MPNPLIQVFTDGVVIHHPDMTEPQMVCLDSKGAWLLIDGRSSIPLKLESLARVLAEWFNGWISPIDGHALGPDYKEELGYSYKASIKNPHRLVCDLTIYDFHINYRDLEGRSILVAHKTVTIPECAAILKEWFE